MTRKIDKVLATDTLVGAGAVLIAWAVQQFTSVQMSVIEAGALIVFAQSAAHKIADRACKEDRDE